MSFGLNNSTEQSDKIFESFKILETTVEALNQQIKNNFDPNGINPIIDNKLNTIFNGMATLNNKIDFISKTVTSKFQDIERKIDLAEKNRVEDLIKLDQHMEKNTVILEFLKATVGLLEETVDILNDDKNGSINSISDSGSLNNPLNNKTSDDE